MNEILKNIKKGIDSSRPDNSTKRALANLIGLTMANMDHAIQQDIIDMIDAGRREGIGGYILCLSRVIRHDLAWELITKAFESKGEKPPTKYQKLFGQDSATSEILSKPRWSVG